MNRSHVIASIIIAIILLATAWIVIAQYQKAPTETRKCYEFASAIIGGSVAFFGILWAFLTQNESVMRQRRERSFQLIDQLNDLALVKQRVVLASELESEADVVTFLKNDREKESLANVILGIFEDTALAIRERIADESMLYESLGFMIPYYYKLLRPFIENYRSEYDDNRLFMHVEKLADSWVKDFSYRTGKKMNNV